MLVYIVYLYDVDYMEYGLDSVWEDFDAAQDYATIHDGYVITHTVN